MRTLGPARPRHALTSATLAAALLATSCYPALGEVMDKVPTIQEVWTSVLWWAPLSLVACAIHPALLAPTCFVCGSHSAFLEVTGAFLLGEWDLAYPMCIEDRSYVLQSFAGLATVLAACLVGWRLYVLRRRWWRSYRAKRRETESPW
jgi:hypothetical protein